MTDRDLPELPTTLDEQLTHEHERTLPAGHTRHEALRLLDDPNDWAHRFLAAYTGKDGYGTVSRSLKAAGVSKRAFEERLRDDIVFNSLKRLADDELKDAVRYELYDRALNGTVRPIIQRGYTVGYERVVDNRLLMFLAERLMPEEFHLATKFELGADNAPGSFKFALGEKPLELGENTSGE